jgi:hypothetical protein
VRFVTRAVALLGAVLLLGAPAGTAAGGTLLTVSPDRRTARLVEVDRATLQATGRSLAVHGFTGSWAFSPDGRRLAVPNAWVAATGRPAGLTIVDVAGLREVRRITMPRRGGVVRALAWPRPDRLLAVLVGVSSVSGTTAIAIDPASGRVVAQRELSGTVLGGAATPDGLALLVGSARQIVPARVHLLDADASVRTATLDRVRAGFAFDRSTRNDPHVLHREPGIALDPGGRRIFVVGADEPAATIDLRTLRVAYRAPARTPQAVRKSLEGPVRSATWLGGGLLGVTGWTDAGLDPKTRRWVQRPAGLAVVDTRTWTSREIDADAGSFAVAGTTLVTAVDARGVAGWTTGGQRLWTMLEGRRFNQVRTLDDRVLVQVNGETGMRILDARTGTELGRRTRALPLLLSTPTSPVY